MKFCLPTQKNTPCEFNLKSGPNGSFWRLKNARVLENNHFSAFWWFHEKAPKTFHLARGNIKLNCLQDEKYRVRCITLQVRLLGYWRLGKLWARRMDLTHQPHSLHLLVSGANPTHQTGGNFDASPIQTKRIDWCPSDTRRQVQISSALMVASRKARWRTWRFLDGKGQASRKLFREETFDEFYCRY